MQPLEQGHVELREGVMVDDVLRDRAKEPQAREANCEPNREMEPQVFAPRKARGHKRPRVRVAHLELLQRGLGKDLLPRGLCTLDEPGAVPLKPAPPERKSHDQRNEQDAGQAGLTYVMLEPRQITAEHVAERSNDHGPARCAQRVIEHEGAVRHACRPCKHGSPGTQQDRKSTRLNSSHGYISYAVFCLKKKKKTTKTGSQR